MAGIAALHESRIVHADLKPPNVYLIRDTSLGAGYQLKLIDMDFSVLADRRAPWHGHQGYVGSDNYRSPEHITRGAMPGLASDVFTCGLILYELLAGTHPYWREDQAEYASAVRAYAAKPPVLAGQMPGPATNAEVSTILHRCLAPNAANRPTAAELRAALSGRGTGKPAATRPAVATSTAPAPTAEVRTARPRPVLDSDRVQLVGSGGRALQLGVRTEVGKHLVGQFGSDAEFWDARQCVLERRPDRRWQIVPVPGVANETLVNGERVVAPQVLREGDVIAVGRKAAGIVKLPLTVSGLGG
jgi:hypothetical protein